MAPNAAGCPKAGFCPNVDAPPNALGEPKAPPQKIQQLFININNIYYNFCLPAVLLPNVAPLELEPKMELAVDAGLPKAFVVAGVAAVFPKIFELLEPKAGFASTLPNGLALGV